MIQKRCYESEGGQNEQEPRILHNHDQPGISPKGFTHGRHFAGAAGHRPQKRGGNVEAGMARQNPSVEETGQKNENHGESKDGKMLGQR